MLLFEGPVVALRFHAAVSVTSSLRCRIFGHILATKKPGLLDDSYIATFHATLERYVYWTAHPCCRFSLVAFQPADHTYSLPRQMSEAGLEQRLRQAEAAVTKAQAAYDTADDESKTLCGQLLLTNEKALGQLREEKLIQLRTATGDPCH